MNPDDIEWIISDAPVGYVDAVEWMENRARMVREGSAREAIWLLEHPPLYTAGTSADPAELIAPRFPVFVSGRGGRYTYHGPGQRVAYLVLDLARRGQDIRRFVAAIERWVIGTLGRFDIEAFSVPGRVGIWTATHSGEAKIGALGIRVRKWVSLHGFSVNIDPDLEHFGGIIPCGLPEFPVTSMAALHRRVPLADFDAALHDGLPAFLADIALQQST